MLNSVTKGSSLRRTLFGITLLSGGVVGGAIAYSHYDPEFKQSVDTYIPGFSNITDRSVILWNKGTEVMKKIILPERRGSPSPPVNNNNVKPSSSADKLESENNSKISSDTDQSESPPTTPPTTDPVSPPPDSVSPPPDSVSPPLDPPLPPVVLSDITTETVPLSTEATPSGATPSDTIPSSETSVVSTEATPKATPTKSTVSEAVTPVVTTPPSVARLQEVFERYSEGSETVLNCIDQLKVSLDKCNEKVTEGVNSPSEDEKEIENIVGKTR